MSPFDLRGPEFLVFYLSLGMLVLMLLFILRRFIDPTGAVKVDVSDPYLIAFLRGGKNELLRVATVSLIHRKLLQVSDTMVSVTLPEVPDGVRIPVERELLLYFCNPKEAYSVFSDPSCSFATEPYSQSLQGLGLLPDHSVRTRRLQVLGLALALLLGVALIKIGVALSRGHTNIGFLILLAIVFGIVAAKVTSPRLTLRGTAMLDDLRFLFGALNSRSSSSFAPNDVALLAAVFGLNALPLVVFPYARTLYAKAASSAGSFGSSGDGGYGFGGSDVGGGGGGDVGGGCGGGGSGGGGCGGCGS